jgi:hypothetical protein
MDGPQPAQQPTRKVPMDEAIHMEKLPQRVD